MLTRLLITRLKHFLFFVLFTGIVNTVTAQTPASDTSSFKTRLMNIEAASSEVFRYNTTIHNASKEELIYDLKADLPPGWLVTFRAEGSQITSLGVSPGQTRDVSVEINAAFAAKPDKYKIPVHAISAKDSLTLHLEAVVKGSYAIELTTPTGKLSEEVVAGGHQEIQLVVKNSGTLPLNDVELSSQLPTQWGCTFEPSSFKQLEPGKSVDVKASLKVPEKTIAGDYVAKLTAKNPNTQAEVSFRIIVKTSLLSGWIGILVILAAIGLIYYLIRKYGRR